MPSPSDFWPAAPDLRRDDIHIECAGETYLGHLVAPPESDGARPLVMVIHNYQGLKFFDVDVAEYLARVGYVGLAIDMYGDRVPPPDRVFPTDPSRIEAFQKRCFEAMVVMDHDLPTFRGLVGAWLDAGQKHPSVDSAESASAIGYCFGGVAVLEAVRAGLDLASVVSFHGLLQTGEDGSPALAGVNRPPIKDAENVYNTQTVVLVENGADDHLVPAQSMTRFFEEMDNAGVDWIFHHHARTPHGFALPTSLGPPGHLHEATDRRSTVNMLSVLREVYPQVKQNPVTHNAAGTSIPV
jgi:dienelactone hydrolase